ncbi:hypothetical protein AMBR_MGDJBKAP_02281 [Leuconostoc pseudomesenteroides]|nr:hypothetical protein AMBR_MGDJBKAP_02281 [Leuconostoc pseudomesenteroides]
MTGLAFLSFLGMPRLRPICFLITLLAVLTLPRLASQLGEAGRGKIDLKIAAIKAGMAPVAKIICQVCEPKPLIKVPVIYEAINPIVQ